jgi:hypothetical protein
MFYFIFFLVFQNSLFSQFFTSCTKQKNESNESNESKKEKVLTHEERQRIILSEIEKTYKNTDYLDLFVSFYKDIQFEISNSNNFEIKNFTFIPSSLTLLELSNLENALSRRNANQIIDETKDKLILIIQNNTLIENQKKSICSFNNYYTGHIFYDINFNTKEIYLKHWYNTRSSDTSKNVKRISLFFYNFVNIKN